MINQSLANILMKSWRRNTIMGQHTPDPQILNTMDMNL